MPVIPAICSKRRARLSAPAWVKLALLLLVVFGLMFSGWLRKKERSDVRLVADEVTDFTSVYADVYFLVENTSSLPYEDLPVMIRLYAEGPDGSFEVASMLVAIDVAPHSSERMGRRLERFTRMLAEGERPFATVEIHQHDTWF
ncbi:MAG: hypothetical protein K8R90_03350 [Candidatus Cloacimonetes bacterium]|nr:hypothetical protein [Candidatus Cloacimonadota bacterium]